MRTELEKRKMQAETQLQSSLGKAYKQNFIANYKIQAIKKGISLFYLLAAAIIALVVGYYFGNKYRIRNTRGNMT